MIPRGLVGELEESEYKILKIVVEIFTDLLSLWKPLKE